MIILFLHLLLFWHDFFLIMGERLLSNAPHKLSQFYKTLPSRSKQAVLTLVSIGEYKTQGKRKAPDLMSGTTHNFCQSMKVNVCIDKTFISSYFKGKTSNSYPKHKNF